MTIYRNVVDVVRLLPEWQSAPTIRPRIFVVHTMVGSLLGTEAHFFRPDIGVEAHFGVGGPWDAGSHDGEVRQWQDTDRQADAQWDGNPFCVSAETSDGGNPDRPWSEKQITALITLGLAAHHLDGIPLRIVTSWDDPIGGFGWHRQFPEWNRSNHSCPGDVRLSQYVTIVFPRIVRLARGVDNMLSPEDRAFFEELDAKRHQDMVTLLRGESHASLEKILTALQSIVTNTTPAQ